VDKIPTERRSENMRRIRGRDTRPELAVRKICRELGYTGYRLHRTDLPGKPDLAWIGRRQVIFVHGCFWHGHDCAEGARVPKSNQKYWIPKIERNRLRDIEHNGALRERGWRVLVVWECNVKDPVALSETLRSFLSDRETM
jgi:DNA mismatch endonuclease (patch repair protein)